MFLDNLCLLSDAQAFTGAATVSTNVYDFGPSVPKREVGTGEEVGVGYAADVAAGAGSTILVEILQSATANMATPDVIASFTDVAAAFPAGRTGFVAIPAGFPTKQFVSARVTATGGTTTITLTIWLTPASMFSLPPKAYAKGYAS